MWLSGSKEETEQSQQDIGQTSIAHYTIEALREIGLLDDVISTKEGIVVYPSKMDAERG